MGKDKKYRARKKLKLKKDQRRVEALTGRVEELEKQVCLLEDASADIGGLERILTSLNTVTCVDTNSLRWATRKPDATHSSS